MGHRRSTARVSHVLSPSGVSDLGVGYEALCELLWTERTLVEDLLFALHVQHLVLRADPYRWLVRADARVDAARAALHAHELLRAVEVRHLAGTIQAPQDITLAGLLAVADEPWSSMLRELHAALSSLTEDVEHALEVNRGALAAAAAAEPDTSHGGSR